MQTSERHLVAVAGLPGSGKTTLSRNLVERYGFQSRNIGDELARLHRAEYGLPADAPVGGRERMPMHKKIRTTDPDYFARFCIDGAYERRVIDGLRNVYDTERILAAGGHIISLVAPRPVRFLRRMDSGETTKDLDVTSLLHRELSEMDDPGVDGAQAIRVMAMADSHGFYVDASRGPEDILQDTIAGLALRGVEL